MLSLRSRSSATTTASWSPHRVAGVKPATSNTAEVEGLRLHYLEQGKGDPVLLLHGWPTSSFLWRNLIPILAEGNRVLALDLPGFGRSDKPLDASYSFRFFDRVLEGFLDQVGAERTSLAVHDIGGPVGLYWASEHSERLDRLALLNTLAYPRLSWAAVAFVAGLRVPGPRSYLTSAAGLKFAMRVGIYDNTKITDELLEGVQAPFRDRDSREALRKAGIGLHPDGLKQIAAWLPSVEQPVRIVYGTEDRILPDVERTMTRVAKDVPHAEVTALPECGHFLQEDRPEEIAGLLAEFFAR